MIQDLKNLNYLHRLGRRQINSNSAFCFILLFFIQIFHLSLPRAQLYEVGICFLLDFQPQAYCVLVNENV